MNILPRNTLTIIVLLTTILSITGCDENQETSTVRIPEGITPMDACHICGMNITRFPGPKGQAFIRHQHTSLKFCSTIELFSWLLQPDTPAILQTSYVHDMGAATSWKLPSDEHFVDTRKAWYVADHDQHGAMGPTLASFKEKQSAETFMKQHGGRLLDFSEIDLKALLNLQQISSKPAPVQHSESHQNH